MTAENIKAVATHIISTGKTVRLAAKEFNVSKSTIHKNITEDLKNIDSMLYYQVREVLDKNKAERHMRGGLATKAKYKKIKGN